MSPSVILGGAFTRGPLPKSKEWGNKSLSTSAGMQLCPSSRYAVILVTKGRLSSLVGSRPIVSSFLVEALSTITDWERIFRGPVTPAQECGHSCGAAGWSFE